MSDLKSFSVGHTAKGAIWWQAWPFDGEPRKGTADTIGGALDLIGVGHAPSEEAAADAMALSRQVFDLTGKVDQTAREYRALCAERADDREQVRKALAAKDAEIARLTAIVARMESLLPDSADPSDDPAHDAPAKGPASPAKARKVAKGPDAPAYPADGPEAAADPVGSYLAGVRRG